MASVPQTVRPDWLHGLVDHLQAALGEALNLHPEIACAKLRSFGDRVPPATNTLERFVLRAVLFEHACRTGAALHEAAHTNRESRCGFDELRIVSECFVPSVVDPRLAYAKWTHIFGSALRSAHPETAPEKIARHIQEHYDHPLDAERLAMSVGLTSSGLRRAFRAAFGRSMREYQSAVRLLLAMDALGTHKVTAVATAVGFRSKKNFYTRFKKVTGLTPATFRKLPSSDAQLLMQHAWMRLRGRRHGQ